MGNLKAAAAFGELFAKKAKDKGFSKIIFDRAGYLYHGRVKAFAESARKGGLQF
jgi:large subunit ribosomal protein L18